MNRKRAPKKHSSFLVKKKQERELLNKSLNASTEMTSEQMSSLLNSSIEYSTQDSALNQTMPDIRSDDIFSSNIIDIPVEDVIPEETEQKKEDESFEKANPNPQNSEAKKEKEVDSERGNNKEKIDENVVIQVDEDGFEQSNNSKGKSIKKAKQTKVRSKPRQNMEEEDGSKARSKQNPLDVSVEQPKSSFTKVVIVGSIFAIAAAAGVYFYMKSSKKTLK